MRLGVHARMWDNPWYDEWRQAMLGQLYRDWELVTDLEDIGDYDAIVFTDSDDVPGKFYLSHMRIEIAHNDVVACAARIIGDTEGRLALGDFVDTNSFGFTNTCYRTEVLEDLLPFPDVVQKDYWLAKTALTSGYDVRWDDLPLVAYRRYGQQSSELVELGDKEYAWKVV